MAAVPLPTTLPVAYQHGMQKSQLDGQLETYSENGQFLPPELVAAQQTLINEYTSFATAVGEAAQAGTLTPAESQLDTEWIREWTYGYLGLPYVQFPDAPPDDLCQLVGQNLIDAINKYDQLNILNDQLSAVDTDKILQNLLSTIDNLDNQSLLNIIGNGATALSQLLLAAADTLVTLAGPEVKVISDFTDATFNEIYASLAKARDGMLLDWEVVHNINEVGDTGVVRIDTDAATDAVQLGAALRSDSAIVSAVNNIVDIAQAVKSVNTTIDEAGRIDASLDQVAHNLSILAHFKDDQTNVQASLQNAYNAMNAIIKSYTGSCISNVTFDNGEIISPGDPAGSPPPRADTSTINNIAPIPSNEILPPEIPTGTSGETAEETFTPLPPADDPNTQVSSAGLQHSNKLLFREHYKATTSLRIPTTISYSQEPAMTP